MARRRKKEKRTELFIGLGAIILGIAGAITFMFVLGGEAGKILSIFWGCVMLFSGVAVLAKDYSTHREYILRRLQDELKPKYDKLVSDIPPRPAGSRFIDIENEYTADCWKREKTLYVITSWGYMQPTLIADSKKLFGEKKTADDYVFIRRDILISNIKSIEIIDNRTVLTYLDHIDNVEKNVVMEERAMQILPEIIPEYFK